MSTSFFFREASAFRDAFIFRCTPQRPSLVAGSGIWQQLHQALTLRRVNKLTELTLY